jgi:hypothetical protein
MPINADFQKILSQFTARFGDKLGKTKFEQWITKRNLDTSKPYSNDQLKKKECLGANCKHNCAKCLKESFQWAKPLIELLKTSKEGKTYRIEAHFAVTSMNNNIYTREELITAISTLPSKHIDLNHNLEWKIDGAKILATAWESECVECIVYVYNGTVDAKGRDVQECLDNSIYDCVSIEGDSDDAIQSAEGNRLVGFYYTGLAFLDQEALPGIPLTTIQPIEEMIIHECLLLEQLDGSEVKEKLAENTNQTIEQPQPQTKEQDAAYCPICGKPLTNGACTNPECTANGKQVQMSEEKLHLTQKIADLTEQLSAKTIEQTHTQTSLSEANGKIEKLSTDLAKLTRENVQVAIGESQNKTLKEQLANAISETNIQRGKVKAKAEEISKLEEQLNKEHAALQRTEESLGKREAENEALRRELNEESTRRATAEQKALNETKECSRIKLANASLLEEKAKDTRQISDLSEKQSQSATNLLKAEKELAESKETLHKREEDIKTMQAGNDKAIVEQKRLYKILKENNIYEINPDGTLKVSA